ncbi:MAG TPA: LapA family protein [Burkholderiaceae bacterium]|nr:LapA family protein [Burkholderiaceae bacterium]
MRIVVWLVRAVIFFTLFAFALNNQHEAAIRWFFGQEWRAPMVFIVLAAFALGCAFGAVAMVPSWWRHRRVARKHATDTAAARPAPSTPQPASEPVVLQHPPRDGL